MLPCITGADTKIYQNTKYYTKIENVNSNIFYNSSNVLGGISIVDKSEKLIQLSQTQQTLQPTFQPSTLLYISTIYQDDIYTLGIVCDSYDNIYFSDTTRIFKISIDNVVSVIAGNGNQGYSGDGELAINAELSHPGGLTISSCGDLFFTDTFNNVIRVILQATGIISTIAGNGYYTTLNHYFNGGFSGDGGLAIDAEFNSPIGVAIDSNNNIYVADSDNARIRMISSSTNIISTIAGNGQQGYSGDGGLAINAKLNYPNGLAIDSTDNIYFTDTFNARIRMISSSTGVISTIAGNGQQGYSGVGGLAINAKLYSPYGLAIDSTDNIYIADTYNNRIRMISSSTGVISTIAGNGVKGYFGDGGLAIHAKLHYPNGLAIDSLGYIYFTDLINKNIRKIKPSLETSSLLTLNPISEPTVNPSLLPSTCSSVNPIANPSMNPTNDPSSLTTTIPTISQTNCPSASLSAKPSIYPTDKPLVIHSSSPSYPVPTPMPSVTVLNYIFNTTTTISDYNSGLRRLSTISIPTSVCSAIVKATEAAQRIISPNYVTCLSEGQLVGNTLTVITKTVFVLYGSSLPSNAAALVSNAQSNMTTAISSGIFTQNLQQIALQGSVSQLLQGTITIVSTNSAPILKTFTSATVSPSQSPTALDNNWNKSSKHTQQPDRVIAAIVICSFVGALGLVFILYKLSSSDSSKKNVQETKLGNQVIISNEDSLFKLVG